MSTLADIHRPVISDNQATRKQEEQNKVLNEVEQMSAVVSDDEGMIFFQKIFVRLINARGLIGRL